MKRFLCVLILTMILTGCGEEKELERGIALRNRLLQSSGCSFDTKITADYGDKLYTFTVRCTGDNSGGVAFEIIEPESICGITGNIDADSGKFTFDKTVLTFPLLADGLITPAGGPWLFLHALRSGYINGCETQKDGMCLVVHDSYKQTPIEVNIVCDASDLPRYGEIFWDSRRIITLEITEFVFL